jgi:uncharacterized protein YndB with AHSA1/START domain
MTKSTVNETERMVITRVFDAPRAVVWKAWTDPKYVMQWWGPKGFTSPVCKMDFRVGGTFLWCMRTPDGQEGWNAGEYHEIVLHEKIVFSMYFSDSKGNKVEPGEYGIDHEAIDDAHDVVIFEDLGNGRTKLTFIGSEPMESAKDSGQLEGWNEQLDKVAAAVAKLAQAKLSCLSWKWRKRSSVKITERTYEEGTEAFHSRRKSSHLEAASCGQNTRLGAV